jgi:hypothetical protein
MSRQKIGSDVGPVRRFYLEGERTMKIKTALLGITIAGVTALSASCSGSSESSDNSAGKSSTSTAGKSSSTGGASSAGTTGNGGNNNGGTKSGTAGANSTAGTNANGGNANTAGTFNFGGAGFDPADFMCNPVPTKGAACTAGTQPCTNETGSMVCYCQAMKWNCLDLGGGAAGAGPGGGFGQLDCPATKPMNGGDCGDTVGVCPYGQGGCACYNGMWACN